MPSVRFDDQLIALRENESVLEALTREGIPVPSSCRSGVCQSCLMKAEEGSVPAAAQQGLKDSLKSQGYFLSCVCKPSEDLRVRMPDAALEFDAVVLESFDAQAAVRILRLSIPEEFEWRAGQFVTLFRPGGLARSYSIASAPRDGFLELHVRRIPGGAMSNWLHDEAKPGDAIHFRGPFGECFYTPGDAEAPLLLAGTGTGLAPLYGVLREAIAHGHRGTIRLFHGGLRPGALYHGEKLTAIASEHGNVEYLPCVLEGEQAGAEHRVGMLDDIVLDHAADLRTARAFLCGDPALVQRLRRKLFLKGMSNRNIFADPFVPSAPPAG